MPTIHYRASNFGAHWGTLLSGEHSLNVSWRELVWSAVSVGKPGVAYIMAHGRHSISDVIVRAHTVYASLRNSLGVFEKSTLYDSLDPTEKGATSYFLGMMAAKIVAARLLQTPWLIHLSLLRVIGGSVVLHGGKSEPDLVGMNSRGDWLVMEAKGRTHGYSDDAMITAKKQTRHLRRVNGNFPAGRIVVQAYFSPHLQFEIQDPEEYDSDAPDLNFDLVSALKTYYSMVFPISATITETRRLGEREYLIERNDEVGVTIGIERRVVEALDADSPPIFQERFHGVPPEVADGNELFALFSDGLAIALDDRWGEQRMRLEANNRAIE